MLNLIIMRVAPIFMDVFDGNQWVAYENDERGKHEDIIRTTSEDEAFQCLYEYLIGKQKSTQD